tara:strand:+ start:233 stop:595 length:363 start_codon:yes stop_codon:yes gene_type:complete
MIYIGTDIVTLSRIDKIIADKGQRFLSHVFTENEQSICNAKVIPHIHYGGKFAAKEAIKKALLSSNIKKNIPLNNIEIQNRVDGAPKVILINNKEFSENLQVTISHTGEYAIATAILEIK